MADIIAVSEFLAGQGWFAVPSWAVRASDNAIIWRIDWAGGVGETPPGGWLRDGGDLTRDISRALPFPQGTGPIVGANAIGDVLATMTIPAGTAAGDLTADWEGVNPRAEAANGLPGDTNAELRLPTTLQGDENGLAFVATYDGDPVATFRFWGVSDDEVDLVLAPGVVLRFDVEYPDTGTRPRVVCRLHLGPAGHEIGVKVAMAPATIVDLDVNALRAQVNTLVSQVAALMRRGTGGTQPSGITDLSASLTGYVLTLQWREGGQQLHADVNLPRPDEFEPVNSASELAAVPTNDVALIATAFGSYSKGDLLQHDGTAWQVVGSFGGTVVPNPNSISKAMLTQALRQLIDGKLNADDLLGRVFTDNGRLVESRLPKKLDDIIDAFSSNEGWAEAPTGLVRRISYTTPHPANIGVDLDTGYISSYIASPRESGNDNYKAIALPTGEDPKNWRLAINNPNDPFYVSYVGSGWTQVELNDAGKDLYTQAVPDVPVGAEVHLQKFTNFVADVERLGLYPWTKAGDRTPIPAYLLGQAPNRGVTRGDVLGLIHDNATGEQNYQLVSTDEVDAGTEPQARSYSPKLVQRQINDRVPEPQSPANDNDVLVFDGTNPVWRPTKVTVADGRYGAADRTTNLTSILPTASADNRNTMLDVDGRLFFNFDGATWTELAKREDVLSAEDQNYPAHVVMPQGEIANARFQIENFKAATRNDQALTFGAVVPHDVPTPGQPTQHFGTAAGLVVPPGVNHATFYPANYADATLRNRVLFTARPALRNFAPTSVRLKEGANAEQNLAITEYRRGNAFLGYLSAAIPNAAGKTYAVNFRNASANFVYLTDAAAEIQYAAFSEFQARLLAAAPANFIARIRVNGTSWDAGDEAVNWLNKADMPPNYQAQFRIQIGNRTRLCYTDWFSTSEFLGFPDIDWDRQLVSSANRIARQILDVYDAPASDSSQNASSFQLNFRGIAFAWVGWRDGRLSYRTENPSYYTAAGTKMECWIKPF